MAPQIGHASNFYGLPAQEVRSGCSPGVNVRYSDVSANSITCGSIRQRLPASHQDIPPILAFWHSGIMELWRQGK